MASPYSSTTYYSPAITVSSPVKPPPEPLSKRQRVSVQMLRFLESKAFGVVINSLIIYALFGQDFKNIVLNKSADDVFDALTIISLFVFTIEISMSVI